LHADRDHLLIRLIPAARCSIGKLNWIPSGRGRPRLDRLSLVPHRRLLVRIREREDCCFLPMASHDLHPDR
jgi:hypothetical protein